MKINEKLQYKARNYLYNLEKAKKTKPYEKKDKEKDTKNILIQVFDEMDHYLEEKINGYKEGKKPHNK